MELFLRDRRLRPRVRRWRRRTSIMMGMSIWCGCRVWLVWAGCFWRMGTAMERLRRHGSWGRLRLWGRMRRIFGYVMGAQLHDTGYLDVLVEDVANPSLITLTTDSSGTLIRLVGTKLQSVGPMVAADLNGDGHTDLVIQSGGDSECFSWVSGWSADGGGGRMRDRVRWRACCCMMSMATGIWTWCLKGRWAD